MEQVPKELGLYDLLAYFLTGAVALGAVIMAAQSYRDLRKSLTPPPPPGHQNAARETGLWRGGGKVGIVLFVLASYIVGSMIQAVLDEWPRAGGYSNSLDRHYPADPAFREQLRAKINEAFNSPPESQYFNLCQTYAHVRNADSYIQIMLARNALFRGLVLALTVGGLMLIFKGVCDGKRAGGKWAAGTPTFLLALLLFSGAYLSHREEGRFSDYFVDHVYRTFYVSYSLSAAERLQAGGAERQK